MKSYDARNKNTFLRNSFYATDKFDMPLVFKQDVDISNLSFIGFQNTKLKESRGNRDKTVHFFVDDYKFDAVWNQPDKYINKLSQYKQVLSPDFSLYSNMPVAMQVYNTFRRRWCSAFWQAHGLTVIPSIGWGNESSYDFCFNGIEEHSTVAISTLGTKEHKEAFLKGFEELCNRVKPNSIICYCRPFPEIADKVIYVPHEGETHKLVKAARRVS